MTVEAKRFLLASSREAVANWLLSHSHFRALPPTRRDVVMAIQSLQRRSADSITLCLAADAVICFPAKKKAGLDQVIEIEGAVEFLLKTEQGQTEMTVSLRVPEPKTVWPVVAEKLFEMSTNWPGLAPQLERWELT